MVCVGKTAKARKSESLEKTSVGAAVTTSPTIGFV